MTQRSFFAGTNQTIIIKVGGSVTVKGYESDRVTAETSDMWGLTVERRSEAEVGRARAAMDEQVLFDIRIKLPNVTKKASEEVIEVQMGGSGEVLVPFESNLKVYAGKNIDVRDVKGQVDAYSGLHLNLQNVQRVGNASAGGKMHLDCESMLGMNAEFKCGGDLRFHIHDLADSRLHVKDLGGYWEARIGTGAKSVSLKCGGDVTLVTDEEVKPLPPNYILGKIEKPTKA
jgi:hypothetical protein